MAELLHPGIYNVEVPTAPPVEGVATTTASFVGVTERGTIGKATLVTSWNQFVEKFGTYVKYSYLAYAVRGFFENGGTRAYITRVVKTTNGKPDATKSSVTLGATDAPFLIFDALSEGSYGDKLSVQIDNVDRALFDVIVLENGVVKEKTSGVSLLTIEDKLNTSSKFVKATVVDDEGVVEKGVFKLIGGKDGYVGITTADYIGDEAKGTGLYSLNNIDVNFVSIPGVTDTAVVKGLQDYVANRNDCYAIIETPFGRTPETALAFKREEANLASKTAGVYYPWVQINDPIGVGKTPTKFVPPSGHIAGVFARTLAERGVWKAPAGLEAKLRGALAVEYAVNDAEHDLLNPAGINVIRAFSGEGIVIWGARNSDLNSDHKYIPDTVTMQYVRKSLTQSTRWAIFEPNDEKLFEKIQATGEEFLRGLWQAGGLRGTTEAEAFYFVCNSETTTIEDIQNGRTFADWGIATQKPSEFLVYRQSLRK